MKHLYLLLFLFLHFGVHLAIAQQRNDFAEMKRSIVNVKAGDDTGGGLLVGQLADSLYIITAKHVIHNAPDRVEIQLAGDSKFLKAKVAFLPVSEHDDFALLSVYLRGYQYVPLGETARPDPNANVFIFRPTNPMAMVPEDGSALLQGSDSGKNLFYVYSDKIHPGDSGSAVFEGLTNRVIGIVVSSDDAGIESISNVLKINRIRGVIANLFTKAWQLKRQ